MCKVIGRGLTHLDRALLCAGQRWWTLNCDLSHTEAPIMTLSDIQSMDNWCHTSFMERAQRLPPFTSQILYKKNGRVIFRVIQFWNVGWERALRFTVCMYVRASIAHYCLYLTCLYDHAMTYFNFSHLFFLEFDLFLYMYVDWWYQLQSVHFVCVRCCICRHKTLWNLKDVAMSKTTDHHQDGSYLPSALEILRGQFIRRRS